MLKMFFQTPLYYVDVVIKQRIKTGAIEDVAIAITVVTIAVGIL